VQGVRTLVSQPHTALRELATLAALYGLYEVFRGFADGTLELARRHTEQIVALERSAGIFWEREIQRFAEAVPSLPMLLGVAYIVLHFGATTVALVWVYRRHRLHFALVRTTLVLSTAIALAIYVAYPAAPPRLAALGFSDTVSTHAGVNLSSDLLGSLYNPFAAVPSLHFGYALLVGVVVSRLAGSRPWRLVGALYAPFVLFVIVATGNHFVLDAAAGGAVTTVGWLLARPLAAPRLARSARPHHLPAG